MDSRNNKSTAANQSIGTECRARAEYRIVQVEVYEDKYLFLCRLEEGQLDVLEDNVKRLAACGLEPEACGMKLEHARCLLAADVRPNVNITKPMHFTRADDLEWGLRDEIRLQFFLLLTSYHPFAELLDQPESVVQVRGSAGLQGDLANVVVIDLRTQQEARGSGLGHHTGVEIPCSIRSKVPAPP